MVRPDLLMTIPELPVAPDDLEGLTAQWHRWPFWTNALVRKVDDGHWVAVYEFLFTWALITAPLTEVWSYEDRWCYHRFETALAAGWAWDGTGEPEGWHRHPFTNRYR